MTAFSLKRELRRGRPLFVRTRSAGLSSQRARYVNCYHHGPQQFLGYRTPKEVRQTWEDAQDAERLRNQAA